MRLLAMTADQISTLKRAFQKLGYSEKTYLSRKEISRLIEELNLDREYALADYVQSLDPARLFELLGR
jgi:Ca2+-binding EF-hand superfamily protein